MYGLVDRGMQNPMTQAVEWSYAWLVSKNGWDWIGTRLDWITDQLLLLCSLICCAGCYSEHCVCLREYDFGICVWVRVCLCAYKQLDKLHLAMARIVKYAGVGSYPMPSYTLPLSCQCIVTTTDVQLILRHSCPSLSRPTSKCCISIINKFRQINTRN